MNGCAAVVAVRRSILALALLLVACSPQGEAGTETPRGDAVGGDGAAIGEVLSRGTERVDSAAAALDDLFRPLPLLTPGQESSLRRYGNPAQLSRARALGIERAAETDELRRLEMEGALVRLEDSAFWVVGTLDYSSALVVPGVHELLEEIGRRFQEKLDELGAPPLRFEISSVLRSAEDQTSLRRVNPNAALGESAHEYATTVDVLYSAFSAPLEPFVPAVPPGASGAAPFLERYAALAAERVAGRRALELKAILGEVLLELQEEGRVMVTLERQQPVFHMTLAAMP